LPARFLVVAIISRWRGAGSIGGRRCVIKFARTTWGDRVIVDYEFSWGACKAFMEMREMGVQFREQEENEFVAELDFDTYSELLRKYRGYGVIGTTEELIKR